MRRPKDIVTVAVIIFVALVVGGRALLPIISTNAEIKRQRAGQELEERIRYQQTVGEAELAEQVAQARKTIATRAMAGRVIVWCGAISLSVFMIGAGMWGGRTLYRRSAELPPVQKIGDGLYALPDMTFDRYSGRQISVKKEHPASQEHAFAYAIAKSAERDRWVRWGYRALEMLPMLITALKDNDIEPPQEAMRVMEALPIQEGSDV